MKYSHLFLFLLSAAALLAQTPAPQDMPTPVFRTTVVARTAKAVNYRSRSGATKVDFQGTALLPASKGQAKVESKQGYIEIEVEFRNLEPATKFGPEYLTYVMWAVTPEGRASNLGEVLLNGTNSKLNVSTELQSFGLIVTAEPYYAVTMPSDVVVMENVIRQDTLGRIEVIDAKFELLQRGQYEGSRQGLPPFVIDSQTPLELYEARNAMQIAKWTGADKYASGSYAKALKSLEQAEEYQKRKRERKPTTMMARDAVQGFEDARAIAVKRIEEEKLANERAAAAEREARAKAAKEAEERRRLQAEADQRAEAERRARAEAESARAEAAKIRADAERAQAELIAAREAKARAEAEADSARAKAQEDAARQEAERARKTAEELAAAKAKAEREQAELREALLKQFSMILETRDTARGLVVNMSDVLFDSGKFTLRPLAREKLARLSGIVLAHPGLKLDVEGHTDSIGSDNFNQKLSEKRAQTVQKYLVDQGLSPDSVAAQGFGKTMPVADNKTAQGRQQNRRVELIVSGEIIGTKIGEVKTASTPQQ